MELPQHEDAPGLFAFDSPTESVRFDRVVRRYVFIGDDHRLLVEKIADDNPDLAIVRIPTSRTDILAEFASMCDDVILGDCLVIYTRDNLNMGSPTAMGNQVSFREADEKDFPLLDRITERCFTGYRNHYSANPTLGNFNIVDGYKEWTRSHVGPPDKRCLLAYVNGEVCGYGTVRITPEESECVLTCVLPEFRGTGVYRDTLRGRIGYLMSLGSPKTIAATQAENLPVQRVLTSEGFSPSHSYFTVHLNLFGVRRGHVSRASASGEWNLKNGQPEREWEWSLMVKFHDMIKGLHSGRRIRIKQSRLRHQRPIRAARTYEIGVWEVPTVGPGQLRNVEVTAREKDTRRMALSGRVCFEVHPA